MRILALQGSPRLRGNTNTVLEMVMATAQSAGARTETVQLFRLKNITGCRECFACHEQADQPGCAVKDDMQAVIDKIMKADLIVWATPVFCWSPAWPLKMALDRLYCTFKFGPDDQVRSLLKGRRMAAVITAGGGADDGADLITETCRRVAKYSQTKWLGALVVANATDPEALRQDRKLAARARAFGQRLVRGMRPAAMARTALPKKRASPTARA